MKDDTIEAGRGLWERIKRSAPCWLFGHHNSGEYVHHVRVWQWCARCGHPVGWMFRWQVPWTREEALDVIERTIREEAQ